MAVRDLGIVTAYGYAVAGGYTGTEQEFTALLGDLALTVEDLENMTVSVTTLEPDQQATASYADGVLSLGIPRGRNGEVTQDDLDAQLENYATNEALLDAYIVKSASGSIASFTDGADGVPMKSLKVAIVPKQAGSGDPSPSNVRPISGWTDADVKQCASLLKPSAVRTETINGITFQSFGDGSYRISGTSTAIAYCPILPIEQFAWPSDSAYSIYLNNSVGTGDVSVYFFDGTTQIDYWTCSVENRRIVLPQPSLTGKNCNGIRLYVKAGMTIDMKLAPMVSKAPTTTPVPLGQTVYGGEVNPISGELVIDRAIVDIGSMAWTYQSQYTPFYSASIASLIKPPATSSEQVDALCSCFKVASIDNYANYELAGAASGNIFIKDSDYTDADAFKTAMAGQTICYKLKNPTTVQLTPTQVATLLGTNNVWSDAGSVAVEYRADPTLAYNGISPSIASAIAPVEETNIATRNYTTGSYLIMDNTLYKVTAAIASGGTITVGTNVAATTIMAEIIAAL